MVKTVGRIPERKELAILSGFYGRMAKLIMDQFLRIQFNDFRELEAEKMKRVVEAYIRKMNRFIIKWANASSKKAYWDSAKITRTSLKILGFKKSASYGQAHNQSIKRWKDLMINDLIKANNSINISVSTFLYLARKASKQISQIQAFDLRVEDIIAESLDEAIREGASRSQLDQLIRKHFHRALYERKFININGRNYDLIKYAKMVGRTRLRRLQSEATKNMCAEYNNDLVEISDHGTECDICREFEGNIYSINGDIPGYEVIPEWPPFHPNCEHSAFPTSEAAIRWRESH